MHLAARAAQAALTLGRHDEAARHGALAQALLAKCAPFDIDQSEVTWALAEVMAATDDAAAATELLERCADGLRQTAQHGMPAPWRDAFLQGNPANRRVLAAVRVA